MDTHPKASQRNMGIGVSATGWGMKSQENVYGQNGMPGATVLTAKITSQGFSCLSTR